MVAAFIFYYVILCLWHIKLEDSMNQHSCVLSLFQIQDKCADMMTLPGKALAAKSNNLGLIPGPTRQKEKMTPAGFPWPPYMCCGMCMCMPICMFIHTYK